MVAVAVGLEVRPLVAVGLLDADRLREVVGVLDARLLGLVVARLVLLERLELGELVAVLSSVASEVGDEVPSSELLGDAVSVALGDDVEVAVPPGVEVPDGTGAGAPLLPSPSCPSVVPVLDEPLTAAETGLLASASLAVSSTRAMPKTIPAGSSTYFHGRRFSRVIRGSWAGATRRTRLEAAVIDWPYSAAAVVEMTEARPAPMTVPATPR